MLQSLRDLRQVDLGLILREAVWTAGRTEIITEDKAESRAVNIHCFCLPSIDSPSGKSPLIFL